LAPRPLTFQLLQALSRQHRGKKDALSGIDSRHIGCNSGEGRGEVKPKKTTEKEVYVDLFQDIPSVSRGCNSGEGRGEVKPKKTTEKEVYVDLFQDIPSVSTAHDKTTEESEASSNIFPLYLEHMIRR
jgi:hypothetical protein